MYLLYSTLVEYRINDEHEEACDCRETCDEGYYEISKSETAFPSVKKGKDFEALYNITPSFIRYVKTSCLKNLILLPTLYNWTCH